VSQESQIHRVEIALSNRGIAMSSAMSGIARRVASRPIATKPA